MEKDPRFKEYQQDRVNYGKGIVIIFFMVVTLVLLVLLFPQFGEFLAGL
jgi:hypothetical protein